MFPLLAVCLVVSSNIASVMSSSLTFPKSSVVVIGDRVEMKCNVNGSQTTKWSYTAWNTSTETEIYLGIDIIPSMRSRYRINKTISVQHNLIIDSVDFTYAGRYRCTTAVQEMPWNDIQLTVLVATSSSVVLIGERVEMKCSVTGSDSAAWKYIAWNTSTETNIYLGTDVIYSMRSRYKIDKRISGHHNLIIDSVDFGHAGRYRCYAAMQQSLVNDIYLTVLGSSPECSANTSSAGEGNMQQGYLWMWCRTIYTGNIVPIFTWNKDKTKDTIIANTTTASGTSRLPLTTISSVNRQLTSNDNGATFKCKITFQLPNIPKGKATEYENIWSYTLYGPRNLSIVEYEDRLECSADGNPTPTYRWTLVDTRSSMEGPVFILGDKEEAFHCTATNVFASERKNFKPTKADKISAWGLQTVGLVLIIPTLVFGIVLLGIGLKLRKLSIAFDEDKASGGKSSLQPQQSSKRLNSPQPTDEYAEAQMADASANYCAFTDRSAAAQQTEVYCELRTVPNKHQAIN